MIVLLLAGCAARVGVGGDIDGMGAGPEGYRTTFERWTQEAVLYDGFATVLRVKATVLSPEMRKALTAEEAAWVRGGAEVEAGDETWTVVFAAASQLDDLGFGERGAWQAGLLVDGQRCAPVTLEESKVTALTHRLYPTLTPWDRQWTGVFSGCALQGDVELQVTSAHGAVEIGWQVVGDDVSVLKRAVVH